MAVISRVLKVTLGKLISFLIFLLLLAVANILTIYFPYPLFIEIVRFLNSNLWLIILIAIIFFLGDLFSVLDFPLNLPYPLFSALGSILVMLFVFSILFFLFEPLSPAFAFLRQFEWLIIAIVALIVLLVRFYDIFTSRDAKED